MHKVQMYENLMDMLEREVKDIANKNELDAQSLDTLYKVMMSIKAADKHMETLEGGMSRRSSYDDPYMGSYENMSHARRDSNGRYSRDNFRDSSYRGQSYENSYGYSRDKDRQKMVSKLQTLMDDTMSEYERSAIMDCIDKIK